MKIEIIARGFYDTNSERWRLLKEGEILTVAENQYPAPCRSKEGNGKWSDCGVFVETENFKEIDI